MRQLTFVDVGTFEWHDVPLPQLQADTDALIRPLAVARCDLDLHIATGCCAVSALMWALRQLPARLDE
jgi:threonine dehydrogenase-like Zn-dependent dehydrogenase